ncbi:MULTISPECIES: diguanylate cyclase domain-containing protein [Marinobacter]|uniref:diguanylate cyclase domain-containing protein n=1 Tax=Marinobacter TaxID=2742 RepID=UPI001D06E81D|nr:MULTISPECIES: diguanylate cyclase [Marinobacter]MCK7565242.1 diguanylate cyclase [Marinobacter xestospongiae]UDL06032.1 diguanylate cyclase [Marinobacter sp. CA1]
MNKPDVLIVEDSAPIIRIHSHLVRRAGFTPTVAKTLAEAKALEDRLGEFFCAIIDYNLPDAPNGEAIDYLLGQEVPGVVMTGRIDDDTRAAIWKLPVIDYITKESRQSFTYLEQLLIKLRENQDIKVLIVDDSVNSRMHLIRLLRRQNYEVLSARTGIEALKQLSDHPDIKLIITDKEMPEMDGIKLCNEVRSQYSKDEISIVGVSGVDNPSLTAKFIKNGANDFLKKPFCPEEFYCRVTQNIEYIENIETIRRQAHTDALTGLYNRRYFFQQLAPVLANRHEQGEPSTLAMLDIDLFKNINDSFGHQTGDDILQATASMLQQHFGEDGLCARFGGEEFCLFLDQLDQTEAEARLEQFRCSLEDMNLGEDGQDIRCTISIGLAHGCEPSLDALINQADHRLYQAKSAGRNRIVADASYA